MPAAWLSALNVDVAAGTTLMVTALETALKSDVFAAVTVILTLPTLTALTVPVLLSFFLTVASFSEADLNEMLPYVPETLMAVVFPTAIFVASTVSLIDWAAFAMVNFFVTVPL